MFVIYHISSNNHFLLLLHCRIMIIAKIICEYTGHYPPEYLARAQTLNRMTLEALSVLLGFHVTSCHLAVDWSMTCSITSAVALSRTGHA